MKHLNIKGAKISSLRRNKVKSHILLSSKKRPSLEKKPIEKKINAKLERIPPMKFLSLMISCILLNASLYGMDDDLGRTSPSSKRTFSHITPDVSTNKDLDEGVPLPTGEAQKKQKRIETPGEDKYPSDEEMGPVIFLEDTERIKSQRSATNIANKLNRDEDVEIPCEEICFKRFFRLSWTGEGVLILKSKGNIIFEEGSFIQSLGEGGLILHPNCEGNNPTATVIFPTSKNQRQKHQVQMIQSSALYRFLQRTRGHQPFL